MRHEGSWPEQLALLFRDYMRTHPGDCKQYGELKYRLAEKYTNNRHMYTESKDTLIWEILQKTDKWSQNIGWIPQGFCCKVQKKYTSAYKIRLSFK